MLSTAAAEAGGATRASVRWTALQRAPWAPSAGRRKAASGPARRLLPLAAVAAAHLALLLALAHALRLPVVPPALATLSVQLLSAEASAPPAPAALPDLAPPAAPRLPAPVWAPLPVVVAEASIPGPGPQTVAVPTAPAPPAAAPATLASVPVLPAAMSAPPATPASAAAPAPAPERQVAIDQVAYLQPPVLAYPLAARRLREQGQVLVRVRVDEAGRPAQAVLQQSSGSRSLDEAALAAVATTRFKPYREGGVPRPFWVVMPLVFSLDA